MKDSNPAIRIVHQLLRARDWQDRTEFRRVCDWWRHRETSFCALIGIGGAGKTAIVERFVRTLPKLTEPTLGVEQNSSLPAPGAVFVFSFYEEASCDKFFDSLFHFLVQWIDCVDLLPSSKRLAKNSRGSFVLELLESVRTPLLLVLDGLERVQDATNHSALGSLKDMELRELLTRVSSRLLRNTYVIATSRLDPSDLDYSAVSTNLPFARIEISELSEEACVALLTARGVSGALPHKLALASQCHFHALTTDLAASFVVHFCNGDARTPLSLQEPCRESRRASRQNARYIDTLEGRMQRLITYYYTALLTASPESLQVLLRACLFPQGVSFLQFNTLFCRSDRLGVNRLKSLQAADIHSLVEFLAELRLTYVDDQTFSVHPAVQESFLELWRRVDAGTIDDMRARITESLLAQIGEAKTGQSPIAINGKVETTYIVDRNDRDMLEEALFQKVQMGSLSDAYRIHRARLGGFDHLGKRLGDYSRGCRICALVAGGDSPEATRSQMSDDHAPLINEWGLYLFEVGRLVEAEYCFRETTAIRTKQKRWINAAIATQNDASSLAARGQLRSALERANFALENALKAKDASQVSPCHSLIGHIHATLGNVDAALASFDRAIQSLVHKGSWESWTPRLYGLSGVWYAEFQLRIGEHGNACQTVESILEFERVYGRKNGRDCAYSWLIMAYCHAESGSLEKARELAAKSHRWAVRRGQYDVLCRAVICLVRVSGPWTVHGNICTDDNCLEIERAMTLVGSAMSAARQRGYSVLHAGLLLERAKLHLLQGCPKDAMNDVAAAIDHGQPPDEANGLPEIMSVSNEDFGSVWLMAEGLELRGRALLLHTAKKLGANTIRHTAASLPTTLREATQHAEEAFNSALECWKLLRNPNTTDANFVDPVTGREHNRRAALTINIVSSFKRGQLTHSPLPLVTPRAKDAAGPLRTKTQDTVEEYDAFLSYNTSDRLMVRRLANALNKRGVSVWFDEWCLRPGTTWQESLERIVSTCKAAAVCVGSDGIGPWERVEMDALLRRFVDARKDSFAVIPVLLPKAPDNVRLPMFLAGHTWVNLRTGLRKAGLDRLEWGITGTKRS